MVSILSSCSPKKNVRKCLKHLWYCCLNIPPWNAEIYPAVIPTMVSQSVSSPLNTAVSALYGMARLSQYFNILFRNFCAKIAAPGFYNPIGMSIHMSTLYLVHPFALPQHWIQLIMAWLNQFCTSQQDILQEDILLSFMTYFDYILAKSYPILWSVYTMLCETWHV